MKSDLAEASVIGTILLVALVVVSAGIISVVIINAVTEASYTGPQTSFEISSVANNMMYHAGGDVIDWAVTRVMYNGEDITKYCKTAEHPGDDNDTNKIPLKGDASPVARPQSATTGTGEVIWFYDSDGLFVPASKVAIISIDGTKEFMLYKGPQYNPLSTLPTVTLTYLLDGGNRNDTIFANFGCDWETNRYKGASASGELVYVVPENTVNRDGYTFIGWEVIKGTEVGRIYSAGSTFTITQDTELRAYWINKGVTLTYLFNGGTGVDTVFPYPYTSVSGGYKRLYDSGDTVDVVPNTPVPATKDGYSFAGWKVTSGDNVGEIYYGGTSSKTSFTINNDTVLTAQWKSAVKLTYLLDGGEGNTDVFTTSSYTSVTGGYEKYYESNSTVTVVPNTPVPATKDGYSFAGWKVKSGDNVGEIYYGGTSSKTSFTITKDTVLVAQWGPIQKMCFDANGINTHHDEWTGDGCGWQNYDPNMGVVHWFQKCEVDFAPGNTLAQYVNVKEAKGYHDSGISFGGAHHPTFIGWGVKDKDGVLRLVSNNYVPSAPTTFYGVWTRYYVIAFDPNTSSGELNGKTVTGDMASMTSNTKDGSEPDSQVRLTVPAYTCEDSEIVVLEWNTKANGTGTPVLKSSTFADVFNIFTSAGDDVYEIKLYAQWGPKPVEDKDKRTLVFNANGGLFDGNSMFSTMSVNVGTTVTSFPTPTLTGCTFDGWYAKSDCSGNKITSYTVNYDTELFAKWKVPSGSNIVVYDAGPGGHIIKDASGNKIASEPEILVEKIGSSVNIYSKPTVTDKYRQYTATTWFYLGDWGISTDQNPWWVASSGQIYHMYPQWTNSKQILFNAGTVNGYEVRFPTGNIYGGNIPDSHNSVVAYIFENSNDTRTLYGNYGGNDALNTLLGIDAEHRPYYIDSSGNRYISNTWSIEYQGSSFSDSDIINMFGIGGIVKPSNFTKV